jgi:hypothetical protein
MHKKTNFGAKIGVHKKYFCLFTQDTKILVFRETWRVHIDVQLYVLIFCSIFFDILNFFFPVMGAYAPMFRFEFLDIYMSKYFMDLYNIRNILLSARSLCSQEFETNIHLP